MQGYTVMEHYPITTTISEHNSESAELLLEILSDNSKDESLKNILTIDLSFINDRAYSLGYIEILDVQHLNNNTYTVHYTLDYNVYNGCTNLDENGDYETSMNFNVFHDYIEFDLIDIVRDTVEEF
ncbi:hypothetical protein [Enterobacter cloacae]|uniref:hypothetical protein n=1 Tax=Enterobacter cloacae TaxID=550 RepID=UPI00076BE7A8|nr:hypothetical protein [Enterobacter cloacae]KVJ38980.1 hypothetical protein AWS33_08075 [Enterobacter cloacae subsp. cloacae]